jgi:signal peptidase I
MGSKDKRKMVRDTGIALLSEGKSIRIKAHGYSMYPCIRPGSVLLIEPLGSRGMPVPGEIIAIETDSGMIVHRLTKYITVNKKEMFIARGDSNTFSDQPQPLRKIAGRVTSADTSAENKVAAVIGINTRPAYLVNRLRVIGLNLWMKIRK